MRYTRFLELARATTPALFLGRFLNQNAVGVSRDLGRLGVPLLVMDCSMPGLHTPSRYAAKRWCPDPHHEEEAFLEALEAVAAELPQQAVLFPGRDDYLVPIAHAGDRLRAAFLLTCCSGDAMARCNDKWEQIQAARRAGVETPRTVLLRRPEDVAALDGQAAFPAVLKPATPQSARRHLGLKVLPVARPDDLPAAYDRMCACGDLLLQEHIPGGDDQVYYLGSYISQSGEPLAVFTGHRLRQHPRGSGSTRVAESVWVPEVAQAGLRLLHELGYHGISMVEFKRDPRDGAFKLLEINARHYGTHSLAAACGVNLSAAAYQDACGRPCSYGRQREGVRWTHATTEVVGTVRDLARGEFSLREWSAALRGVRLDGMLVPDDPLPGAADVARTAAGTARGIATKALRSRRG